MNRSVLQKDHSYIFFLVFASFLAVVNLGYYHFLNFSFQLSTLFYAWLLEFTAIGVAYQSTELILSLLLPELKVPRVNRLKRYPAVALLCCTCDDVDADILGKLRHQTYPNLHIFILDDSQLKESQLAVDSSGFKVIRRSNRVGYKAGNLNNWLFRYGSNFPYFVVIDADSILPDRFIEEIMCYAEHPDNYTIAIFESLLHSWNNENEFVRLQTVMQSLNDRYKLRIGNRFHSSLSVGHNNLYRTAAILDIGGFNENYLSEDHATSIEVLRGNKWLLINVPLIAYERLPANLHEYAKRRARYAFQTFQLLNVKTFGLSWQLRFTILNDLYFFLMPIIASGGIVWLVFFNLQFWLSYSDSHVTPQIVGTYIRSKFSIFWTMFVLISFFLRTLLSFIERVTVRDYIRNIVFHSALFIATIWPVLKRFSTFFSKKRLGFNVTGKESSPSFLQILKLGGPSFALIWMSLLSSFLNPIFSGLNLIWILPASLSPFLIYYYQKRPYERREGI